MFTKLLIPLDGSKNSEKVVPLARVLAARLRLPIELLEVIDVADVSARLTVETADNFNSMIMESERVSREHLNEIAEKLPGGNVTCSVERGKPADVIIEKAALDPGTLIAMATHGRSGIDRWMLGSVAEKVLRGSRNPLFLVRANEEDSLDHGATIKSVLVPLDGSELAASVLPTVVEIANTLDLEVVLCRAYEIDQSAYYGRDEFVPNYDGLLGQLKENAEDYLNKAADSLKRAGFNKVSCIALAGSGAEQIADYSRQHPDAMVVMCTHGRSGVSRWVLGSVTEKVVRHSSDPVLVLHAA
jgi:nucleotide-binding universal stress UspA family protein